MSLIRGSILVVCAALSWNILSLMFKPKLPPIVEGYFHPKFRRVAEIFRNKIENGKEKGAAFALYYKGELLIDLWGGYADEDSAQPWDNNTLTLAFSISKSMAAITAAKMVEKGWLDYSKPVSAYWPEFKVNSKDNITVEMLLSHQAGLLHPAPNFNSLQDILLNKEELQKEVAEATPEWPSGTQHGYHMLSFALLVDTLLQKADVKHRNIGQIFKEEIADEYGIDFFIGLPYEENYRVTKSTFITTTHTLLGVLLSFDINYIKFYMSAIFNPTSHTASAFKAPKEIEERDRQNNPVIRAVPFTSSNGYSSAKALAKIFGILASGGTYQGKQLLSKDSIEKLNTKMVEGLDNTLLVNMSYGRGFIRLKNSQGDTVYGHTGYGGQVAFADMTNQFGLSYVTNYPSFYFLNDDPRFNDLEKVTYVCFQDYSASQKT
ncbi:beta-lactamase domain-containing protein 2 isoform X1 [Patella vulgata]|uniref:beta-lactamase domain-containing protein 2 isoform X1 n=1 Tax=Patella vulgata TaxID=6465 RepID=UPI0024A7F0E4|nr:beta-lactamase domain-containing protein 2 isoform X1 [Patella vulgata]